ncbi:MAG: hypothetical protein QF441_04265 [Bacteriovoracaceae bacterium]|jgi:hypothetical protein|nr:hypothetical protein [Bacteriovoracaceae bacterium]|tara:strand:+ start:123 stop:497 length:375 start_codon:yes stop_codon:yes gene_type:complete
MAIKILLISLFFISPLSLANNEADLKEHMLQFLTALKQNNHNKLKQLSTKDFYQKIKTQSKNINVSQLTTNKIDFKIKKALIDKKLFYINIKKQSDKNFSDYWYTLKQTEPKKYKITNYLHVEN